MMLRLRRLLASGFVCVAAIGLPWAAAAMEDAFPFDRDLVLDVAPMRGSKRVPILEIAADGDASIQLWCVTVQGKATVGADTIAIVPTAAQRGQCGPDSMANDENLLAAIAQATGWRRHGDVIELTGAQTLRFRLMTN
jgi:heat shock protein HslJ